MDRKELEKILSSVKEPVQRLLGYLAESISKYETEIEIVEKQSDGAKLQEQISVLKNVMAELENQLNEQRGEIRKAIKVVERDTLETLDKELEDVRRQGRLSVDELDDIDALGDYFELLNNLLGRKLSGVVSRLDQNFRDNFFDAVQNQYTGIITALEEKLETTETESISFDLQINVNAKSINAGIENFNEMKEELKKRMEELEARKKDLAMKEDELIILSYQSEELKNKLDRVERSQNELANSFCPPEATVTYRQDTRPIARTGLFHGFRDWLLGKKTETYTVEDKDDSERKAYIARHNDRMKQLADKQDELERKLEGMLGADKKLEITSAERAATQAEIEQLREEERRLTSQFNGELNKKYDKEIERIKKKAIADIDSYLDEIRPEISKNLKDNRSIYVEILQDLVEQPFKEKRPGNG